MTTETKLRVGIVISTLLLLWTTVMWNNNSVTIKNQQQTIDSLTNISDSLRDESFIHFVEASRYEIALEIYRDVNPKAVEEIELIKTTQTE
jgi:hypothetical protein